jgi:hypothetical protein
LRFFIGYSQTCLAQAAFSALRNIVEFRRNSQNFRFSGGIRKMGCTIFGQAAVDGLHSIDSK